MENSNSEPGLGAPLGSMQSTMSVAMPEPGRFTLPSKPVTSTLPSVSPTFPIADAVSLVVVCAQHQTVVLSRVDSQKGLWFPVEMVKPSMGVNKSLALLLRRILTHSVGGHFECCKDTVLLNELRLQVPHSLEYITRLLFYTTVVVSDPSVPCCVSSSTMTWYPLKEVATLNELWGSEPIKYAHLLIEMGLSPPSATVHEVTIDDITDQFTRKESAQRDLLLMAGCAAKEDLLLLYSEFMQHCYPGHHMNYAAFYNYMARGGHTITANAQDLLPTFRAFSNDIRESSHIKFDEFVLGLAALDKQINHGGQVGRIRVAYIYQYYCAKNDNLYDFDIRQFGRDLLLLRNPEQNITSEQLDQEVRRLYTALEEKYGDPITKERFISMVGRLAIRGTSKMFRAANESPITRIKADLLYDPTMRRARGSCEQCREKNYTLTWHNVIMDAKGNITNPHPNKDRFRRNKVVADATRMSTLAREQSRERFSKNIYNKLIEQIRLVIQKPRSAEWPKKPSSFTKKILKVCDKAKEIFEKEPRALKVNSPVYVVGDIHGNLKDLLIFEKQLWRGAPSSHPTSFLFLGDYVDRGDYSVECITYLLCLKLLAPSRFHLIRGNHELREIQMDFTFYTECKKKFEQQGDNIWRKFNEVFDVMPVYALIDEQIFCAHGGIPTTVTKLEQLLPTIPCPMPNPEADCMAVWEMLWNDPISTAEYQQALRNKRYASSYVPHPPGYTANNKRGTAFLFSHEAVTNFLTENRLSHVIRAHEVIPNGFDYYCGGRVITVFSCSKYCGGENDAAVLLVAESRIRAIKMTTK